MKVYKVYYLIRMTTVVALLFPFLVFPASCNNVAPFPANRIAAPEYISRTDTLPRPSEYGAELSAAALRLTEDRVVYDPAYFRIAYPNGDVPAGKGVCTDVVIRAYRRLGIDLQQLVHEDMARHFEAYPRRWGLKRPDTNIDHRRVPNLQTFFTRRGAALPVSDKAKDYQPGDVVSWDLGSGLAHIGIVVDRRSTDGRRYLIVHNIGAGQVTEDCLFRFRVTGHYRYTGN